MSSRRKRYFAKPCPPDWQPAVGELVYLPYGETSEGVRWGLGNLVSTATVVLVTTPDWVLVETKHRGRTHRQAYQFADLRPYPPKRKWQRGLPLEHPS